jgi:hypothetical protein
MAHAGHMRFETRKSIETCEIFPIKIVAHAFAIFFKIFEEHQTDTSNFQLSFLLVNDYMLLKPSIFF